MKVYKIYHNGIPHYLNETNIRYMMDFINKSKPKYIKQLEQCPHEDTIFVKGHSDNTVCIECGQLFKREEKREYDGCHQYETNTYWEECNELEN